MGKARETTDYSARAGTVNLRRSLQNVRGAVSRSRAVSNDQRGARRLDPRRLWCAPAKSNFAKMGYAPAT